MVICVQMLHNWWGQYLEARHDYAGALAAYTLSKHTGYTVRALLALDRIAEAVDLVAINYDPLAAFYLAQYHETQADYTKAISYYTQANAISHAVRVAKDQRLDGELMRIAFLGSRSVLEDVARYFEARGGKEACALYVKAGKLTKALELAVKTGDCVMVDVVVGKLPIETDQGVYERVSDFYLRTGQFQQAVGALIKSKSIRKVSIVLDGGFTYCS
jgi:intraflagellar transport protein 140